MPQTSPRFQKLWFIPVKYTIDSGAHLVTIHHFSSDYNEPATEIWSHKNIHYNIYYIRTIYTVSPSLEELEPVAIGYDIYNVNRLRNRYHRYTIFQYRCGLFYIDRQQYWKCDQTINTFVKAHGKRTASTNK